MYTILSNNSSFVLFGMELRLRVVVLIRINIYNINKILNLGNEKKN